MLRTPAIFLTCSLLAFACASSEVVERFPRVEVGMTRAEVVDLLGTPSSKWPLTQAQDGLNGERLQWGDSVSSLASGAAFRGEPSRAYSVVFDADGKVVRTAVPTWVEAEAAEEDALRQRRAARGDQ